MPLTKCDESVVKTICQECVCVAMHHQFFKRMSLEHSKVLHGQHHYSAPVYTRALNSLPQVPHPQRRRAVPRRCQRGPAHRRYRRQAELSLYFPPTAFRSLTSYPGNRKYIRCLYVYNKIDCITIEEVDEFARRPHSLVISCMDGILLNLDKLLEKIWE